jgi:alpha 1,3-glucosidase
MVVIIDPHLKRTSNYPVYAEAEKQKLLVRKSDGNDFEGWCWSGSSAWVDFFNPESWTWWKKLFSLVDDASSGWRWKDSTDTMFIWNDMNEVRSCHRLMVNMEIFELRHPHFSPPFSTVPKSRW